MGKAIALVALSVLVALLALPGTTYAQRMTGELSGSVVDESGGVIPGADVTVINEASKSVRRSVTNSDGFFAFAALPATHLHRPDLPRRLQHLRSHRHRAPVG